MAQFIDNESQAKFQERFEVLITEIPHLAACVDEHLKRAAFGSMDRKQTIMIFLFLTVWDNFMEIFLLYSNGYPLGAMTILRSMFERTVHLRYFVDHPDEIDAFVDFALVEEHKLMKFDPEYFESGYIDKIRPQAEEIKKAYPIEKCNKCGNSPPATWIGKRSLIDLAKWVNLPTRIITLGYYVPLQEAHPKLTSIARRLRKNSDGANEYRHDLDTPNSTQTLNTAHYLMISAFDAFVRFFRLDDEDKVVKMLFEQYESAWRSIHSQP